VLLFFYTRIIIQIDILTNNQDLYRAVLNELDKEGIRKYTFIKNDGELGKIKSIIVDNNRDILEWINIERKGMKYVVNIEPKVDKNIEEKEEYCNIISTKDAIITKIVASNGMEVKDINDSVKKGDIIISGDIKYNEETKAQVCAEGIVYGTTWYTIHISLPKTYESIIQLDKVRYNLGLEYNNKKIKIFRPRLVEYIDESKPIVNIFGYQFQFIKEREVAREYINYTEEELENNINALVREKMRQTLEGESQIIDTKVLKKYDNDSTIDVEIFIVAEEQISDISTEMVEEEKPEEIKEE